MIGLGKNKSKLLIQIRALITDYYANKEYNFILNNFYIEQKIYKFRIHLFVDKLIKYIEHYIKIVFIEIIIRIKYYNYITNIITIIIILITMIMTVSLTIIKI